MKNILFVALILGVSIVTSCNREDNTVVSTPVPTPAGESKTIENLDASSNGKWTYFSFEKGEVVNVTNPKTDLSWDIAFSRYHIRTNGGVSGTGQGAVAKTEEKDFTKVIEVPSNATYTKDILDKVAGMQGSQDIERNKLISGDIGSTTGWWSYTPPTGGSTAPHFQVNKWIYIVKDAKGNPVKIQLTSYNHSKDTKSGFITFQYKKAGSNNKF